MATWLTHLRVAEQLLYRINVSDHSLFFAGSIAPDTDVLPDISHWCVNGDKTTCDVRSFYCQYIQCSTGSSDFDFYLGYYVHLLTDVIWHKQKIKPIEIYDKATISNIKENWKRVDFAFLSNQKEFYPIAAMGDTARYKKQWFDYYTLDQVAGLVENKINCCRLSINESSYVDMLVKQEIEQFINEASIHIYQMI